MPGTGVDVENRISKVKNKGEKKEEFTRRKSSRNRYNVKIPRRSW
jgi:hypothetical protein